MTLFTYADFQEEKSVEMAKLSIIVTSVTIYKIPVASLHSGFNKWNCPPMKSMQHSGDAGSTGGWKSICKNYLCIVKRVIYDETLQ